MPHLQPQFPHHPFKKRFWVIRKIFWLSLASVSSEQWIELAWKNVIFHPQLTLLYGLRQNNIILIPGSDLRTVVLCPHTCWCNVGVNVLIFHQRETPIVQGHCMEQELVCMLPHRKVHSFSPFASLPYSQTFESNNTWKNLPIQL